ncbi:twin-arginine translocation pathway signal protein [Modestobacter caceresii]|uniref:Twin-arginine translocation pathway signal protein n=1 Tax=Modestobacter caceresii TaxID=1522368 RepID=A0A098YE81_9ACTN|nr:nucleoside hydrolase [Modestobacter caceresii]KGH48742.1 twin-arginine translocation pathway signal protein [Modestobacter caceresii]
MNQPRIRVVVDNDFSGDPDGLVQLAHHALSPSVDLRLVIGSHLRPGDHFDPSDTTADNAAELAREVLALAGRPDVPVLAGSNVGLTDRVTPIRSAAAEALVAEAMRTDVDSPLYVCAGAGLTEVASAWLIEPRIAERLTLVWIGGPEHPGLAEPPVGAMPIEYNLLIDVLAGSILFGDSAVPIWQVPRDAYRQTLATFAELQLRMAEHGPLGARLFAALDGLRTEALQHGFDLGETYILGDSPLVLLTALQSAFEPDPSSSRHVVRDTPGISADEQYTTVPGARPMRIYTHLDCRLMIEDLFAKVQLHARAEGSS